REPDAALPRAPRDRVLHAISREHFHASVIQLHRDVDRDLARGRPQDLAHPVVEFQLGGGFIKPGGGGEPRIGFLFYSDVSDHVGYYCMANVCTFTHPINFPSYVRWR